MSYRLQVVTDDGSGGEDASHPDLKVAVDFFRAHMLNDAVVSAVVTRAGQTYATYTRDGLRAPKGKGK